ncbi:MAG: homoserine O-acetyltransferase [Myxococcales bacterium]|nr:homoserine O-acetyltransferase [Myxococcales bacterium]MCB9525227.1 homoserine O-acetyltransferase [Myxococcales bacterium]
MSAQTIPFPVERRSRPSRFLEGLPAPRTVPLPSPFRLRHGGQLEGAELAYETWGELAPAKDNALLLFTGLSPRAHARSSAEDPSPGWWEEMIGPGHPIDTDRFFVVCFNQLGSCFGSTGPASQDPATGRRYAVDFPVLTIEDIARAAKAGLQALGIERAAAVVGPSMGGMAALAFALQFPAALDRLMLISSAHRCSPFAIAVHSIQREAVRSDPAWHGGRYPADHPPVTGMRLARKMGMISYRSASEWQGRFGRERTERWGDEPFGVEFEVESYLEHHATKFTQAFDANCYLYLSRAMDLFDASEHGGCLAAAAQKLSHLAVSVVGVHTDILFPLNQQQALVAALQDAGAQAELVALDSIQGHDAFLVDKERFAPVVAEFLGRP